MVQQLKSFRPRSSGGFALVLVLAALVLLLGITVGVLSLAGTERRAASLYADSGATLRQVDRVVDIVQSQINAATTEGTFADPVSWASQPGMIRTFKGANPENIYKLYSWSGMKRSASGFTGDGVPANWASTPAVFTDLNAPVNGVFPIVDSTVTVNGLAVTSAPGATASQPCPMPVQWLYVLKDGSLVTGTASGANAAVSGADRADKEIVARVAFWTDDETSKVNVNTASEGLHWDAPKAEGGRERDLGRFQPVRYEVQRFPGHPAGVCLSEVFPNSNFDLADYATGQPRVSADIQDRASRAAALTPRVQLGGSLAAFSATANPSTVTDPIVMGATGIAGTRRILPSSDVDRLYATVDEMGFSGNRTAQGSAFGFSSNSQTTTELAGRSFFLTAHSSAPETTLFETPKVSLWPIRASANLNAVPSKTNRADAYDKMIALASSLPGNGTLTKYYFQRENALSNNELGGIERNRQLYDYLKSLTGKTPPGFSQSLASAWGATNRNSVLVQTFDMIRGGVNLTEGGLVQYSTNPAQPQSFGYPGSLGGWDSLGPIPVANANNFIGHVQSTQHDGARGFGTVPFITRLGVGLYCEKLELLDAGGNVTGGNSTTQIRYTLRPAVLVEAFSPLNPWGPAKQFRISAKINSVSGFAITAGAPGTGTSAPGLGIVAGSSAARGTQSIAPAMDAGVSGTGYSSPHLFLVRPTSAAVVSKTVPGLWGGNFTVTFPAPTTGNFSISPTKDISALLDSIAATPDQVAAWGHNLQIASGSLDVSLLDNSGNVYHTAQADFDATPPITAPHFGFSAASIGSGTSTPRAILIALTGNHTGEYLFENRFKTSKTLQDGWVANDGDVVIGKEIASGGSLGGDFRLSALQPNLGAADFEYPPSSPANQMRRHSFARGENSPMSLAAGTAGRLLAGQNFPAIAPGGQLQQNVGWQLLRTLSSGVNGVGGAGDYAMDIAARGMGALVASPSEGGVGGPLSTGFGARPGYRDSYLNGWTSNRPVDAIPAFLETAQTELTFSPNRQVFSSIQLTGGLLRRAATRTPWETLLYSANPSGTHPGAGTDHLYADLFWMPIVDPYPISETFSTAGKVNLNARLEPFGTYLRRETALRAALKAIGIPVVDGSILTSAGNIRKYTFAYTWDNVLPGVPLWTPNMLDVGWTRPLNLDQTLEGIRTYGFFRSATEICNVKLVPDSTTLASYDTFWSNAGRKHTPDNLREQPYAHAYARLTTRSNTYTVHYRVQILKKVPGTPDAVWTEDRDQVVAEYRGKSLIERALDPNATYPDYATAASPELMTRFYRWRTLSSTRFSP